MLDLFVLVHYVRWFGARQRRFLKRYAVIRKVAGSSPNEFTELFQFSSSFQPLYGAVIYSASNRNEYQEIYLR
jgi:hypothetical protein